MSMAIQVSPGVSVREYDSSTVIPAVSTTVGAFAGVFRWGPGYQRVLVDSENTLVNKFGKPDANTFETFFTAANFLSYGNALYVVRTYDSGALNAIANTATATPIQIDNLDDFNLFHSTPDANVAYNAKYPGTMGNSLKISVCDSAAAYQSNLVTGSSQAAQIYFVVGSNNAVVQGLSNTSGQANAAANAVVGALKAGDYVRAGNSTIGYQFLKVTSVTNSGVEAANVQSGYSYSTTGVSISFATNYTLSTNLTATSNTVLRNWEFYNAVDKAPGTSTYASSLGLTTQDEIHVVVVDNGGAFTGTPGQILEVWKGLSRATDAKTSSGAINYYKTVLNNQSLYVWAGSDRTGAATGLATAISNSAATTALSLSFVGGVDSQAEGSITLGPVALGYDLFKSKADVDISLVLQGKAIGTGGLSNYIIGNIAEYRKDCVAFVSPDSSIVTQADPAQYAVDFRNSTNSVAGITYNSSYAFMDGNYKYQYDKYNDVYRWVPLNGDMAGLCVATDFTRDAWYSPAGFNRGQIKNVVKLAFNPNQGQRDLLYKNDVNPIVQFPGQGAILDGDKTMLGKPSAFDRINVRRLFIVLEKAIAKAAQSSLFEFNDTFTRAQFKNLVDPFLRQIQGRRGIYDFRVVCDETNNTQQIIDSNQFVGDIYIKPAKSINFIQLNFVAVRTGVDFNTIVGQF
jgi:hypothetical protein